MAEPDDLGVADTVAGKLVERPDADKLARQVARARIGNKLFAKAEKVNLGRYHLLEMVGAGGMGVVWGAWDPELERRVAIKLVKATMRAARDRIQLEGQALAKLSHPNVVTVFDVGVVEDQVYIVMEWIRGENLRAYCKKPRTVKEVIAVYRAAGEGLAAAHAAGLIHRDFKPDNAIRGDDGRVRVLDFGLARNEVVADDGSPTDSSDATRGAGTPRYMPPEQAEGRPLAPSVDQFAFCVSLREAIAEVGAVPSWIEAIAARGSAKDPKDRFASMPELLHALARDPATIWRRRAIVVGALGATAAAFAIGNLRASSNAVEPCSGSKDEIARVWSSAAQTKLTEHLKTLGPYGVEEATRLSRDLGSYADQWAASHHTACLANERGELAPALYEKNLVCLDRARAGFEQAIAILETVPAERVSDAIVASRSLPDTERCTTEAAASTVEPPKLAIAGRANELSKEIARVRVLAQAADPTAATSAAKVVRDADVLGYPPLAARARLVQGIDLLMRRDVQNAIAPLERAGLTALDAGDDSVFVEAYAREIFAVAIADKSMLPPETAAVYGAKPFVERVAQRLGAAASFERPLLLNNIGVAERVAGHVAEARKWFSRAAEEPRTRDGDVELSIVFNNLAIASTDPHERDRLFALRERTLETLLGPQHVMTLDARSSAAAYVANPKLAATQLRDVCDRYERFHAAEAVAQIMECEAEAGWLAEERGDTAEATRAWARFAELGHASHDDRPVAQAYLEFLAGHCEAARATGQHAWDTMQGEWWLRFQAADAFLITARCDDRLGKRDQAVAVLRTILAAYANMTELQNAPFFQRRLARARATLARLVAPSNEAKDLAEQAIAWYRTAGGYDDAIAELAKLAR